jgi:hypothetical protein
MSELLRYYNLQLFQEDGKWRCLQRSYRDSGQSYEFAESTGSSVSSGSRDPTVSLSDSDWLAPPSQREGESYVRNVNVSPYGWARAIRRRERDLSFSASFNAGGGISSSRRWSTVPTGESGNDDTFDLRLEGTADINDTGETGNFDAEIARLIAIKPSTGDRYYWDSINGWGTSQTSITVTLEEHPAATTVSWSVSHTVSQQPAFGGAIIVLELTAPSADPDGDGKFELDSIDINTAALQGLKRNADADKRPAEEVKLRTTSGGQEVSEDLSLSSADAGNSTWPHGALFFKDSSSGNFITQHFGSGAEHATRSLGGGRNATMDELRLRDRLAQTLSSLRRIEGYIRAGNAKLRDTIQYDGSDFLLTFLKHEVGKTISEVAALELANENLPSNPVSVEEV